MLATTNKFTVTRKQASTLLDVSARTIDRYIRAKKLSARKKGGAILLNEEELQNLKVSKFQNMHGASPSVEGRAHRHIDSAQTVIDGTTGAVEETPAPATSKAIVKKTDAREEVFEELYGLSRREIREYHNKLEAANYRLGQIETQMKHSVPLLDFQAKSDQLRENEVVVGTKVKRQEEALDMLEQEIKAERLNKNIYIGLLFGLLALQPLLWLLLQG
ncbi:MAG: excisionase family DNA binding protein [Oceanicoccus sp.]|jgi:excisionase family DNA binding protein